MSSTMFLRIGSRYTKTKSTQSEKTKLRRFKSFFGITPYVCSIVWEKVKDVAPAHSKPKHLLWGLLFLKLYSIEHIRRSVLGADEKTIRNWSWIFVKLLSELNMIIWDKRFDKSVNNQSCFCSLDGVDFSIMEPFPFDKKWFSHKIRAAGLRYEIALNIRSGDIVWVNGGYPCGDYPGLKLARQSYTLVVNDGERTMADRGYKDDRYFILPNENNKNLHKRIMSRHETVNKRMKQFQILKKPFRNKLQKHPMAFNAVANLVQLMIENGEPLFNVFT